MQYFVAWVESHPKGSLAPVFGNAVMERAGPIQNYNDVRALEESVRKLEGRSLLTIIGFNKLE